MNWQHGTQHEGNGHSAEFNLSAPSYRLPEQVPGAEASYMAAAQAPALNLPRGNSRGRSRMQRNFSKWLDSTQAALGWAVVLVILAIASSVYLQQVSRTALIGRNAELLDFELSVVRQENNEVRQEITFQQSLRAMEQRTAQSGVQFVEPVVSAEEYIQVIIPAPRVEAPPLVELPDRPPERFADALRLYFVNFFSTLGRGVADGE